jgi:micrococcal nuclease
MGYVYTFPVLSVDRVLDGDTMDVTVDLGMRVRWSGSLRVIAIDAPEVHSLDALEKRAGLAVKDRVTALVAPGARMIAQSSAWDKFGRLLGDVQVNGVWLSATLLTEGLVRPYHGEAKPAWDAAVLQSILTKLTPPAAP